MTNSGQISEWLDSKFPINKTIGEKKYELMIKFFKKELKKFDFYESDNGVIYCLDINSKEWIFVDKNNQRDFFYNRKYFSHFLFRVFDLIDDGEYMNEQLVKRLIFDSINTLNELYYNKYKHHYWESIILCASFTRKLVILKESLELMFKELEFKKSNEYGGFTES
jgi:hypothetical protein